MENTYKELSVLFLVKNHPNICKILHGTFGEPVDSYWNGSHTWFEEPDLLHNTRIEWRLHPVSGFDMPKASRPEELFEMIIEGSMDVEHYIEGLEVFPVDENEITIEEFKKYVFERINIEADFSGFIDHESIANEYEKSNGDVSITSLIAAQLR